jgi:hypothetical protein
MDVADEHAIAFTQRRAKRKPRSDLSRGDTTVDARV